MKIALAIHAFPPYSRAGSENYVEALAQALSRRHEVTVFHRIADPERPEYELTRGSCGEVSVVRMNRCFSDLDHFEQTYRSRRAAAAFASFLDHERPDVVHFHHLTCLSTTCVSETKRRGIPIVCTLHDFWIVCPRSQLIRRDRSLCETNTDGDCVDCMADQLPVSRRYARARSRWRRLERFRRLPAPALRRLIRRVAAWTLASETDAIGQIRQRRSHMYRVCEQVDRFISPSQFLKQKFVDFGVPASKIDVSDNGFDLRYWPDAPSFGRHRRPRAEAILRVVYLGTWIPTKGVHLLLEAFGELAADRAELTLHGYAAPYEGYEDYEAQLRKLAGDAPHIRFGGAYEPKDVPRLLAEADVLVVPSIWYENSPLTIHEGFLAGLPIVCAGHGGMAEFVVHEKNGLHFTPGSAESLRGALQRLIDDRGLLGQLALGVPSVKSIDANARELEAHYRELCQR